MQAIAVDDVSFAYPGEAGLALDGVSLTMAQGSCFGLLGPNGAGKSTLLALLCGILPLQSGRISILGEPLSPATRARMALVPQDYAFYPSLTCRENLACFAGLYNLTGARKQQHIDFAVQTCALSDVLDRRAATCSGGVRRRLNLAIGLLNRPQLLLLDEPTVGIDAQSRHFILASIRQLQAEGITVVYTSHYMEEIQAICDTLAIIDHGKRLLQDSLAHVLLQAENLPECAALREAKRLEDFYLSLTQHALRD